MWRNVTFPLPGSHAYIPGEFRTFSFHLAKLFNGRGERLITDSTPARITKLAGDIFLTEALQLSGGGVIAVHTKGSGDSMIVLFEAGAIHLTFTNPEDEYTRPKWGEQLVVHGSYAGSLQFVDTFTKHLLSASTVPESNGNVYAMISGSNGPEFKAIGHGGETLIRENYSAAVMEKYDRIASHLAAKVPPGRINIMSGPPGTGKTYLIRGLIQQIRKAKFAIVQAGHIAQLANPGTLPALLDFRNDKQPIVFVIEDAEECLAVRDVHNNSGVSALLNMGDGVLGSLIDLRIIATTNTAVQDLDPAIRRPGRLSTICEVGPLSADEAWKVYDRLTQGSTAWFDMAGGWDPKASYTIAEVYQKATDSGWKGEEPKKVKRSMGFATTNEDYND